MNYTAKGVIDMSAVEKVEELAKKLEAFKILKFLEDCKEEGYSLEQAIAELKLIIEKDI